MDMETFTVLDYTQYRLYLEEANKNGIPEWKPSHKFTQLYGVPSLEYHNFDIVIHKMQTDNELFKKFMHNFYGEGPRGLKLYNDHKDSIVKFITCRATSGDLYEYNKCLKNNYMTLSNFLCYAVLANLLDPKWEFAKYP